MSGYHEPYNEVSPETRDFSRALNSLKEEIEAIDWYQQRIDVTNDQALKKILEHNRDEEIEHACMALEWLRKNMPGWNEELKENLFIDKNPADEEEEESEDKDSDSIGLGVGKIKNK